MILKDLLEVTTHYQIFRLVSFDLAGNACSTQHYRHDEIPNKFFNIEIKKIINTINSLEVSLDIIGDPFH